MSGAAPPRFLEALLARLLPAEEREEVLAVLADLYRARVARHGRRPAALWYARHGARFLAAVHLRGAPHADPISTTGGGGMRGMGAELKRGVRRLRRAPVFAAVAILTTAVGSGAFASAYSVVDTVLLEPPPYREPDALVWVWRDYWFDLERGWLGGPDIAMLREHDDVFEDVIAFRSLERNLTGQPGDPPRRVHVTAASTGFFELLGTPPVLGRGFQPEEGAEDAALVTVLSHELWRDQYGSDPSVIGRQVFLNDQAATVVGVAPPRFPFVVHSSLGAPSPRADLFIPLQMDLASLPPGAGAFAGLARIRPGVTAAQADAAIDAVAEDLDDIFRNRGLELWSVRLKEDLVAAVRPTLLAVLSAAALLLLALAANLTSLFLGRATQRDRELALLSAMGAGRASLVQSSLAESLLVAFAGGALGLVFAWGARDVLHSMVNAQIPGGADIRLDVSVLGVSLLATLGMAIGSALLPASAGLRGDLGKRLRDAVGGGGGRSGARVRSGLVVVQVALSLVLLVGSGLITRAFVRLLQTDPGFDGRSALTITVALDPSRYPTNADVADFDRRFRAAVSALPGVGSVGATDALPFSAQASQTGMSFPGAPGNTGDEEVDAPLIDYMKATPGFMEALGMRLVAGRPFDDRDEAGGPSVAIIDDQIAARFFPGVDPLGRTVAAGNDTALIVGVVVHARQYPFHAESRPQLYYPMAHDATASLRYVIAGTGDLTHLVPELRRTLDALDPQAPLTDPMTLEGIIAASMGRERLGLTLLSFFAAGALLVAVLGLYGVVSHAVSRRTHEFGVRLALGAERGQVMALVLGHGLRLTALGSLLGAVAAVGAMSGLERVMGGVDPGDPVVYAAVALLMAGVAAVATWVPARRATRIDPRSALTSG